MIGAVVELAEMFQDTAWAWFIVFLRISAIMAMLPAFGERSVPMRVKLGLAFAFLLIAGPSVVPSMSQTPDLLQVQLSQSAAEIVTGLFFGLMLRIAIMSLQIAGTIAAQATSLSQIFGASAGVDPMPAMGNVLVVGGLALCVIMDLHIHIARYIVLGFDLVGVGTIPNPSLMAEASVLEVTRCFSLAFSLAAPFVVASLIYNITLGVINRAMPQLMVAFVGAPAITAGGLALLAHCAPIMLSVWHSSFLQTLTSPFGPVP